MTTGQKYLLCVHSDQAGDLEAWKVYRIKPDESASAEGYVRVFDESGEDYLYPESMFVPIEVPQAAEDALVGHHERKMANHAL